MEVSSLSVPNGSLSGTVTGTPVKPGSSSVGGTAGDVSTLGWWEDFRAWWIDQTEKAKNFQDISSCKTPDMQNLRAIWNNTKDLPPTEQLELQQRIGYNVYRFGIDNNGKYKNVVSNVLANLAKSTKIGKDRGYRTAEEMWGVLEVFVYLKVNQKS